MVHMNPSIPSQAAGWCISPNAAQEPGQHNSPNALTFPCPKQPSASKFCSAQRRLQQPETLMQWKGMNWKGAWLPHLLGREAGNSWGIENPPEAEMSKCNFAEKALWQLPVHSRCAILSKNLDQKQAPKWDLRDKSSNLDFGTKKLHDSKQVAAFWMSVSSCIKWWCLSH